MTTNRIPPIVRRAATGTVVCGLAVAAGGAGAAGAASSEPPVGSGAAAAAADEIQFPIAYEVGQTTTQTGRFSTEMGGSLLGGQSLTVDFEMALSSEVTEVDEDGGGVMQITFDSTEVLEAPAGADLSTLDDLVGVTYTQEFDADGELGDIELVDEDELTDGQRDAFEEFGSQAQAASVTFPDEAVAVGATWSEETEIESEGIEIPMTFEYELVALDAEIYTLEMTATSDFSDEIDGTDVEGEVLATGTVVGRRDNPLAMSVVQNQQISMDADGQGNLDLTIELSLEADGVPLPTS